MKVGRVLEIELSGDENDGCEWEEKERLRFNTVVFLEAGGRGGTILHIPKREASFSILSMKDIGSWNSVSVGWYCGAKGRVFSHGKMSS